MLIRKIFVLLFMLFNHVVDDFYLQGVLAKMKQREWWIDQLKDVPDTSYRKTLYNHDYLMALFIHAFSWTFMIHLPLLLFYSHCLEQHVILFLVGFLLNLMIHFWVDHLKANLYSINLVKDQLIHLVQVFVTWTVWIGAFDQPIYFGYQVW